MSSHPSPIHIPAMGLLRTLCGQLIEMRADGRPRKRPLQILAHTQCVDESTCKSCWRADDALQVRDHRESCARAQIDPNTLEPLTKKRTNAP